MPAQQSSKLQMRSLEDLETIKEPVRRYQDSVKAKYQNRIWLNEYQFDLYKAATEGLTIKHISTIPVEQRRKIVDFHTKAQKVLNLWKQKLINQLFEHLCSLQCNNFPQNPFNTVFKGTVIRNIDRLTELTDDSFICDITFAQLKITREQIIEKLISEKILPETFYQLEPT